MSGKLCQATYFERVGDVNVRSFTFVIGTVVEHAAGFVVGEESFLVLADMVLFQACCQPLGRFLAI